MNRTKSNQDNINKTLLYKANKHKNLYSLLTNTIPTLKSFKVVPPLDLPALKHLHHKKIQPNQLLSQDKNFSSVFTYTKPDSQIIQSRPSRSPVLSTSLGLPVLCRYPSTKPNLRWMWFEFGKFSSKFLTYFLLGVVQIEQMGIIVLVCFSYEYIKKLIWLVF